jgi:hypothetical protein
MMCSTTLANLLSMTIRSIGFVRKMRGGGQSHLLQCDDGQFYVVKFSNNPQHPRTLINEWIASACLKHLQISTPETAIVKLTGEFLAQEPDIYIQLGSRRLRVVPGLHFGSRYPGDPAKAMVYDFLPDSLLGKVRNLNEFLGVLAFDKWTGNADARQTIFFRPQSQTGASFPGLGYMAYMIDHGFSFGGPHWTFYDSPLQGLYFRPVVYQNAKSVNDFQPWLDRVVHFPEEVLAEARNQIPVEWLTGDEPAMEALLSRLMTRRERVPQLIWESRHELVPRIGCSPESRKLGMVPGQVWEIHSRAQNGLDDDFQGFRNISKDSPDLPQRPQIQHKEM